MEKAIPAAEKKPLSNASQWLIFIGVLALFAGIWFGTLPDNSRPRVSALWLPEPRPLPEFNLQNHHGEPFTLAQLKGHWSLLFAGYTSCPDVCPTTMADLARIYPQLTAPLTDSTTEPLQIVLLSVDPQRDDLNKLSQYVGFFRPEFAAITGEHAELYPFTQALGLVYALVDNPNGGDYMVDHSADLVLVNPDGAIEAFFRPTGELGTLRKVSMAHLQQDLLLIMTDHQQRVAERG